MIFTPLELEGAYLVDLERREDERGFFARTWCREEFDAAGLATRLVQSSLSYNRRAGTLRGLHWQVAPHEEEKLVRCSRGAIRDVLVDLRPQSPTYLMHVGIDLRAREGRSVYVPKGLAHGFQTLEDDTEVCYQMSEPYEPSAGHGLRWNDPLFCISWPLPDPILNRRDANYPDFQPVA